MLGLVPKQLPDFSSRPPRSNGSCAGMLHLKAKAPCRRGRSENLRPRPSTLGHLSLALPGTGSKDMSPEASGQRQTGGNLDRHHKR